MPYLYSINNNTLALLLSIITYNVFNLRFHNQIKIEINKNIMEIIKANNGMLIVGFYNSADCFCSILRENIKESLKTIKYKFEILEVDINIFDSSLKELCIYEIPTYNIYYKDMLLYSFESIASRNEIRTTLTELLVN